MYQASSCALRIGVGLLLAVASIHASAIPMRGHASGTTEATSAELSSYARDFTSGSGAFPFLERTYSGASTPSTPPSVPTVGVIGDGGRATRLGDTVFPAPAPSALWLGIVGIAGLVIGRRK